MLDVKRQPLAEVRQAELALFRRCADEGEAILLQAQPAPLVYRAVKLNVRAARWPRALEVAQAHRSHVDTVLALRARHLASLGGRAEWLPQFAAAAAAAGPLVSGLGDARARARSLGRKRTCSASHALSALPIVIRLTRLTSPAPPPAQDWPAIKRRNHALKQAEASAAAQAQPQQAAAAANAALSRPLGPARDAGGGKADDETGGFLG